MILFTKYSQFFYNFFFFFYWYFAYRVLSFSPRSSVVRGYFRRRRCVFRFSFSTRGCDNFCWKLISVFFTLINVYDTCGLHAANRRLHSGLLFRRFVRSMELSSVNCSPRDQIVPDSCNGNNWVNEQLDFNWQMQVSHEQSNVRNTLMLCCYLE